MTYIVRFDDTPNRHDIQRLRDSLNAYNMQQAPALADRHHADLNIIACDANGAIIGGAVCESDWGWLFLDTLWVHEAHRRHGLGAQLIAAVENAAIERQLAGVFLMTSSFQALPFYQKQGYTVFGYNRERPRGHVMYYLQKSRLQQQHIHPHLMLHVQAPPIPRDTDTIERGLIAYNDAFIPLTFSQHAVWLRDSQQKLLGGLYGVLWWQWFDLHYMWLEEAARGYGYGAQMLALLEGFCQAQGVQGIVCVTGDFQALDFYHAHGFETFGTLANHPPGHSSYFLQKIIP